MSIVVHQDIVVGGPAPAFIQTVVKPPVVTAPEDGESLCGVGLQQSPIDLVASPKTRVPEITLILNNLDVQTNGAELINRGGLGKVTKFVSQLLYFFTTIRLAGHEPRQNADCRNFAIKLGGNAEHTNGRTFRIVAWTNLCQSVGSFT